MPDQFDIPSVLDNQSILQSQIPQPSMREFTDIAATRTNIYDNVLKSINNIGKLQNVRHTLELLNPRYIDEDKIELEKQKQAILTGKSLHRRIKGTWRLTDNVSGNVLDEKDITIAQVPYMSPRGTFVLNGTEYTLANQLRLRPGIFTRIKENGEVESHVNVMPGNGISHRYFLDPATGIFKVNIGQAKLPLYPILHSIGISDRQLREAWGDQLVNANLQVADGKAVSRLYQRLVRKADPNASPEEKGKALSELFYSMKLDPEVTKRTLGRPHEHLTADAILDATKRLISVAKQEQEPDDRDHLAYQTIFSPEDLLAERITKDKTFLRQLLWKASFKGNLNSIHPGALTRQLHSTIINTGLGQAAEEINPAELLDAQSRTTRLGEGALSSIDAVPQESRSVNPSQFMNIDFIRTPECYSADMYVFTKKGWKIWPQVTMDDELACLSSDRLNFARPVSLTCEHYNGAMYKNTHRNLNFMVTPNHRMLCKSISRNWLEWKIETADKACKLVRAYRLAGHLPYRGNEYEDDFNEALATVTGWALSVGTLNTNSVTGERTMHINCDKENQFTNWHNIELALKKLNKNYTYANEHFIIRDKKLIKYFKKSVFSKIKRIPENMLEEAIPARKALLTAILRGCGSACSTGVTVKFKERQKHLLSDIEQLAFSLGYACTDVTTNSLKIISATEKTIHGRKNIDIVSYDDMVYCAEVPGGLLYVKRKNGIGFWCGNSFKVGIDTRLAYKARKGSDGKIYSPYRDLSTGQVVYKTPQDIAESVVAFPGELNKNKPYVAAIAKGATKYVPREDVKYEAEHMEHAFSPLANLIPGKSGIKGQRMAMGSRFLAQSLSLTMREPPLVQSGMPGQHNIRSFEEEYGKYLGAIYSNKSGIVKKITPNGVLVKHNDGTEETYETYNHFPYARKTFIHNTPVVRIGDHINQGQLLAKSNYTDDNGVASLGINAKTAFVPFKGENYEDAIAISSSFARKLASDHLYQHDQEWDDNIKKGLRSFIGIYPTEYTKEQLKNMDDKGVVKPGTVVKFNDPLVLVAQQQERTHSQIHKGRKPTFANKSLLWEHHNDGIVTDVAHTPQGVAVAVKSYNPMVEGDKLSNRFGGKGVVKIIPDDQMLQDKNGEPFEVLMNPLGIISRCYDEKTEVYTFEGWKSIATVTKIDKVLTHTDEGDYFLNPVDTIVYIYDGLMYRVENDDIDLLVTANHNLYVRKNDKWELIEASQLYKTEYKVKNFDATFTVKPEHQSWLPFNDNVYCVAMPKGHVIYVRRNNKQVWCGNSNPTSVIETALAKIAKKTGQPYKLEDFASIDNLAEYTNNELKKHGIPSTETVIDPVTGKEIPNVLTGYQYMLKLHHLSESKKQGRNIGGYDVNDMPAKGGEGDSSKKLALLDTNALLSHGSVEVLRDAHVVRGQRNDRYWQAVMSGFRPPEPEVPLIYRKYVDSLKASGINVVRTGNQMNLMALTDRDVTLLASNRDLQNVDTVDWREGLKPKKGGLFDPALTGGHGSGKWSAIKLAEPMPNPAFEEPIRRLLGLTQNKFESILSGELALPSFGTGPSAIKKALESINVKKEIEKAKAEIKGSKKTARDVAIRKLGYLTSLDKLNMKPSEWILSRVPVLPPVYRPVSIMQGTSSQQIADPNYLYKELFDANSVLAELKDQLDDVSKERKDVYNAFKGVTGLGDPIQAKNKEKGIKGILKQVFGLGGPKFSMLQAKLIGASVDLVGRAVIVPNKDLDMDELGIPENEAWDVYKPFIIRRLVQKGVPRLEALRAFEDKANIAKDALLAETKERPVVMHRAPVLHRYGIMGFWPKIMKGTNIHVPAIVTKGYGADFDGDEQKNSIYILLTKSCELDKLSNNDSFKQFWELRKMTARFKTAVHYQEGFDCYCVNLEDVPHLPEFTQKAHVKFHDVPKGMFVIAYDAKEKRPVLAEIKGWSIHENCKVEIVNLASGRQIITDDDPRAVYGYDHFTNEFGRWRPKDAIDKYVPRCHTLEEVFDEPLLTEIDLPPTHSNRMRTKVILNYDFGYFLGAIAGDGWVAHCNNEVTGQICFSCLNMGVDAQYRKAIVSILHYLPPLTVNAHNPTSYGDSRKLTLSCKDLAIYIEPLIGVGAHNKHLPPFYLSGPKEFRMGLLAGLIDTDGSVSVSHGKKKPQLMSNISSVSLRLLQEAQQLMRSLGISSTIGASKTPADEPFWLLTICAGELKASGIALFHTEKKEILENGPTPDMQSCSAVRHDVIPLNPDLATEIMKLLNKDKLITMYGAVAKARNGINHVTRYYAKKIIDMYSDKITHPAFSTFKSMTENEDVRWDRVIDFEVTNIPETGYDLHVPTSETFMATDGVILSNTVNFHVPATEEAKKEIIEKMLPSKNLLSISDFKAHMLPSMEYQGGLYHASTSKNEKQRPVVFATKQDAIKAYKTGRISFDTPIEIVQH